MKVDNSARSLSEIETDSKGSVRLRGTSKELTLGPTLKPTLSKRCIEPELLFCCIVIDVNGPSDAKEPRLKVCHVVGLLSVVTPEDVALVAE